MKWISVKDSPIKPDIDIRVKADNGKVYNGHIEGDFFIVYNSDKQFHKYLIRLYNYF
jgi:mRNA-degrading endonuclease YafQ of YafQ-DinJ toxin-antitoxin module